METAMSRPTVAASTTGTATGEDPLPTVVEPRAVAPRDARELSRQFFQRLHTLEEGTHEYQYARNTLIEMNMSLVRFAAGRFRNRGDDMEDIVQVGMIGLIKAIDRFEISREVEFTSFALPYIVGEIKRFFRDTTWAVKVPRDTKELHLRVGAALDAFHAEQGRAPTLRELAGRLQVMFDAWASSGPFVKDGKLRVLAVTTAQPSASVPDLPTVAASGLPGYSAMPWLGLVAPARTPQPVVDKIYSNLAQILQQPDVKAQFTGLGLDIIGSDPKTFAAFIRQDVSTWAKVARDSNIRLE